MALAADAPWSALMGAALVGTDRQPLQMPTTLGALGQTLAKVDAASPSGEAKLLAAAGTVALHQRVGWLPDTRSAATLPPSPSEEWPFCSAQAARCLQRVLQNQYAALLPEWLELAAIAQQRVPPIHLPQLLDLGRQQRSLRSAIRAVMGQRGAWLAAQNPDWSYAIVVNSEADWDTGNTAARMEYLQSLRSDNPEQARQLLQTSWGQEAAGDRAKLLATLRVGLTLADEPFLQTALGDRSKEVRRVATELLSGLPQSRHCQQMITLITPYLSVVPGSPPTVRLELPSTLPPALTQLGIDSKPPHNVGEKAWWLLQLLALTPLDHWTTQWQSSPAAILQQVQSHESVDLLLKGWVLATERQADPLWAEALLQVGLAEAGEERPGKVLASHLTAIARLVSPERYDRLVLDWLRSPQGAIDDSTTLWLLNHREIPWSEAVTTLVLERVQQHLQTSQTTQRSNDWALWNGLKQFGRWVPVRLIPQALQLQQLDLPSNSYWTESISDFCAILELRRELWAGFGQSTG